MLSPYSIYEFVQMNIVWKVKVKVCKEKVVAQQPLRQFLELYSVHDKPNC